MTDRNMEQRLAEAISRAAPNDIRGVLSRCEPRKGKVISMTTRRKNHMARNLIAACLALVLIGGGGSAVWQQTGAVASIVSLDVNPSIELKVNRNEKVLSCEGLNEEAKTVLADMDGGDDLKGTKLDVAANAIVGALVRKGYLDSISSAILISVEDKDPDRAAKLQQELTYTVDSLLKDSSSEAAVLSQTIKKDSAIEKQAHENNISTGKAALISRVMALNGSLNFDALAELSVEELKDLAENGAPAMPIGRDEAVRIAIAYAGAGDRVSHWETDAELDDRPAHYEVELYTSAGEFEYEIEAYSGEVLSGRADIFAPADSPVPPADSPERIDGETAFDIALGDFLAAYPDAGDASAVREVSVEPDEDDGRPHYEVEFSLGRYEADYEIDARTGSVLDRSIDLDDDRFDDDDWDDDDWDDDWDDDDADDYKPIGGTRSDIGSSAAKAAAFSHAGVSEDQVYELEVERDEDDGRLEYEVEFKAGGMEYEYTVDAYTGAILEHEKDRDD